MSTDKFLNTGGSGGVNISNGTVDIYAATLSAANLDPSRPVKTNSVRELVSSSLDISDVTNLQQILDNTLTNPYHGTLEVDQVATERVYDTSQTSFIEMSDAVYVVANDLMLNGHSVLTDDSPIPDIADLETKTQNISLSGTDPQKTTIVQDVVISSPPVSYEAVSGQGADATIDDVTSPLFDGQYGWVFEVNEDITINKAKVFTDCLVESGNRFVTFWSYSGSMWNLIGSSSLVYGDVGVENGFTWTKNNMPYNLTPGTRYAWTLRIYVSDKISTDPPSAITVSDKINVIGSAYPSQSYPTNSFPDNETTDGYAPVVTFDFTPSTAVYDKTLSCGNIDVNEGIIENVSELKIGDISSFSSIYRDGQHFILRSGVAGYNIRLIVDNFTLLLDDLGSSVRPTTNNWVDLGIDAFRFKDLYLSGRIRNREYEILESKTQNINGLTTPDNTKYSGNHQFYLGVGNDTKRFGITLGNPGDFITQRVFDVTDRNIYAAVPLMSDDISPNSNNKNIGSTISTYKNVYQSYSGLRETTVPDNDLSIGKLYVNSSSKNLMYVHDNIEYPIAGAKREVTKRFDPTADVTLYQDENIQFEWLTADKQLSYVILTLPSGSGLYPDYVDVNISLISGAAHTATNAAGLNLLGTRGYFYGTTLPDPAWQHANYGAVSKAQLFAENDTDYPFYKIEVSTGDVDYLGIANIQRL